MKRGLTDGVVEEARGLLGKVPEGAALVGAIDVDPDATGPCCGTGTWSGARSPAP